MVLAPGPGASRVSLNVWPSGPMTVWPLLPVTPDGDVRPGTLTGMVTWLPLPMDTDPLVPLPPAPWDAPTEASAPPWHPAAAMPSRAPALPQTATGGLTGASRPLPPSTATAPGLLLAVPAQATLDRAPPAVAKPTATSAVFAVQRAHGRMGTPCET